MASGLFRVAEAPAIRTPTLNRALVCGTPRESAADVHVREARCGDRDRQLRGNPSSRHASRPTLRPSATRSVRFHITGIKHFHHPVVGDLSLTYDRMELPADPGLTIFTYTAEPGSRSEEGLNLLASWTATSDQAEPAHTTDRA
jgi:hypothetical protein